MYPPPDESNLIGFREVEVYGEVGECGRVTPYGVIELWFMWRHQATTRTNVALSSVRCYGIHQRAISQEIFENEFENY